MEVTHSAFHFSKILAICAGHYVQIFGTQVWLNPFHICKIGFIIARTIAARSETVFKCRVHQQRRPGGRLWGIFRIFLPTLFQPVFAPTHPLPSLTSPCYKLQERNQNTKACNFYNLNTSYKSCILIVGWDESAYLWNSVPIYPFNKKSQRIRQFFFYFFFCFEMWLVFKWVGGAIVH